jgi:DNA-binding MarR family transcriptional regulator
MEPADRRDQGEAQVTAAGGDQGEAQVPAAGGEHGPRWLTDDERDAWIPLIGVLIKLPAALDAQLQRDAGLSHFEYMVLSRLSEAPERTLRMSDLAILANGSLSRLSHVVTRLERRGWVRREACPGDGRYTNAVLTGEGWAKVTATAPGHVAAVRELVVDGLSPEQIGQLRDIAQRIMSRVVPGDDWLGQLPHPARRLFVLHFSRPDGIGARGFYRRLPGLTIRHLFRA